MYLCSIYLDLVVGLNSDYIYSYRIVSQEVVMKLATHVRPISYLKSHAAEIAKDVTETGEPMLITQNGEARLVVMDVSSYEQKEQTLALLKILALGQADIESGRYRDAQAFFAEMDKEEGSL